MDEKEINKILILAPHTDDGEMGCGATISHFIRRGSKVYYIAFSTCEESVPEGFPKNTLEIELRKATSVLGIKQDNVFICDFKVRHFYEQRQAILDTMIKFNKIIKPDIVFAPSISDIHQDHNVIANETLRAFKHTSILFYEAPWNNFTFNNQAFFLVEETDVRNKINALKQYISQYGRDYSKEDYILGLMRVRGVQVGAKYAEMFEAPRIIFK